MTSETKKYNDILVIFTQNYSNDLSALKTFFKSFLTEDFYEIDEIYDELNNDAQIFLGASKKKTFGGDKWKVCGIFAEEGKFLVRSSAYKETYQNIKEAFFSFCEVLKEFHDSYDDDGCYSIMDALKSTRIFSFGDLDKMNKLLIDVGLDTKFYTKYAAGKFSENLKHYLSVGNESKVNESQLENLVYVLKSNNFKYDENQVQFETIKILKHLKLKNYAEFSQKHLKYIKDFLEDNRSVYKSSITEYEKYLEMKPNDGNLRTTYENFIQRRIDFLTSIIIFVDKPHERDLIEVLSLKNLRKDFEQCEKDLENIYQEIDEIKTTPSSKPSELIRKSCEFRDLQKKLKYLTAINRTKQKINIKEFLNEFGKNYEPEPKEEGIWENLEAKITQMFSNTIGEVLGEIKDPLVELLFGYAKINKLGYLEATFFIKLITKEDLSSYDDVPLNILDALIDDESDNSNSKNPNLMNDVINLGLETTFTCPKNYIGFVSNLLFNNFSRNKKITYNVNDQNALKVLEKYEHCLEDFQKSIILLMNFINKNEYTEVLSKMTEMIRSNQKLPNIAFNFFRNRLTKSEIIDILSEVLKNDLQDIPKEIYDEIIVNLNETQTQITLNKIEFVDLLVIRNVIKLHDIENFCIQALEVEANITLKVLYNAIQVNQKIPPKLLHSILNRKDSDFNQSLVKFITNSETKLSKLTGGIRTYEEKLEILKEIEHFPRSFQDTKTIETLIKLVLYDENIAKRAFEVLSNIITKNFKFEHKKICEVIVFALRSGVTKNYVEKFLNIFDLDVKVLKRKCNDKHLLCMLKETIDITYFMELSNETLQFLLKKSALHEDEIKILLDTMDDESFLQFYEKIYDKLKTVKLNDNSAHHIKYILETSPDHPPFRKLLSLLPNNIGEILKQSIENPDRFIENSINELMADMANKKALNALMQPNILNHFKERHVKSLKDICIKICQSMDDNLQIIATNKNKLKKYTFLYSLMTLLKLISQLNISDESFAEVILKKFFGALKIDYVYKKMEENSINYLQLCIALLRLILVGIPFNKSIFENFEPNSWSLQVLTHILLAICNDYNDFDLENLFQIFENISDNYKINLINAVIEKVQHKDFELYEIIDLIIVLASEKKIFNKYQSFDTDEILPLDLQESWLKSILRKKYFEEELGNFKILLTCRPRLLIQLLNADDKNELRTQDFVKIFKVFQLCSMSYKEKSNKLLLMTNQESTTWLPSAELYLIEILIGSEFINFNAEKVLKLKLCLRRIFHTGWSVNAIKTIIKKIKTEDDIIKSLGLLKTISEYQIDELHANATGEKALEIITDNSDYSKIHELLNQVVLHNTFGGAQQKNLKVLCDEISNNNPKLSIQLSTEYNKIKAAFQNKSEATKNNMPIKEWNRNQIKTWSDIVKIDKKNKLPNLYSPSIYETIAVLIRATKIFKGYEPRDIQILSLLILLNPDGNKGRLAQINTGEGKTTIVAMLAVIKALAGHKVDVITSSPELAKPQSIELEEFFEAFMLTVAHNGKDLVDKSIRYKSDIVYGAASDFQGDILRDEFSNLGTRSGRICDFAIIDEVDSMLIDGRNHIVMLSSSMPGMNYLEPIYAAIWMQVKLISQSIKKQDGAYYFLNRNEGVWSPLKQSKESYIKENLLETLKQELIKKDKSTLKVPNHLHELVISTQLEQWIDCAIFGKYYSNSNKNYVLNNSKIVPVDSDNTGVLQESMNWSNGLHQFLQIKHGAKITPESLTTNYISNVAFFRRYGSNLFGLTGTLGSESAKQLLERTYNVDSVIIPPFMVKRYKELSAIVVNNKRDWYDEIVESNMNHLNNKRAVLIITRYISEAKELKERFSSKFKENNWEMDKIREYKTDQESKAIKEAVRSGDLIIATNIAGRGTDIKTSKNVEANGGLHVCVISLPSNDRVEQQNVGRTSRTGNLGTSQFIIYDKHHSDIFYLKVYRDFLENQNLTRAEDAMKKSIIKDEVFTKFCELLYTVPNNTVRKAVEDRFGIWLQMHEDKCENLVDDFYKLKDQIVIDYKQAKVIKNPVYHILLGNLCLKEKKYKEAVAEYTKAIELENEFSEIAYYNRGFARLALNVGGTININETNRNRTEIEKCVDDFKTAREKINNREAELSLIQAAKEDNAKVLSEQVSHKLMLYGMQKNAIIQAIGYDQNEYTRIMENFNNKLTKLKKQQEELPEIKDKFQKIKKSYEQEDSKQAFQKLQDIMKNPEYTEFLTLKDRIEGGENIEDDIKKLQEEIENFQDYHKSVKDGVITKALREGIEMRVVIKDISESLPDDQDIKLYEDEIEEFSANGMLGAFQITQLDPIDWWSVMGLFALGALQMIIGGAICVFSIGAGFPVGLTLLVEGASDIFTGLKDGIYNRSFKWSHYGIEKTISYATSVICLGLAASQNASKTAVLFASKSTHSVTTLTKQGWILAAKVVGFELVKKVGIEAIKEGINYGIEKILLPLITELLQNFITPKITGFLRNNTIVQKLLKLDEQSRSAENQAKVMKVARNIISKEKEKHMLIRVAEGIADHIGHYKETFSSTEKVLDEIANNKTVHTIVDSTVKVASNVLQRKFKLVRLITKIMESYDMIQFLSKFYQKMEIFISKINEEIENRKSKTEQKGSKVEDETNSKTSDIIQLSKHENNSYDDFENGEVSLLEKKEEQIELVNRPIDPVTTSNKLGKMISKEITQRINGNLIAPYVASLASRSVDVMTSKLNSALKKEMNLFKEELTIDIIQNNDKFNILSDDQKEASKNPEIIAKVDKDIEKFAEGGMIGFQHLGSISDALGIQIRVYDEKGKLERIVGKGKPVDVRYANEHYSLKDGSDPPSVSLNKNDCFFNAIGHQMDGSIDIKQMRSKSVKSLTENKSLLAYQHKSVQFLKIYNPRALHEGGMTDPTRVLVQEYLAIIRKFDPNFGIDVDTYGNTTARLKGLHKEAIEELKLKELIRLFKVDINHVPANSVIKAAFGEGPDYQRDNILSHAIDHLDHLQLLTTGSQVTSQLYRTVQVEYLMQQRTQENPHTGIWKVIQQDILDVLWTGKFTGNADYGRSMQNLTNAYRLKNWINEEKLAVISNMINTIQARPITELTTNFLRQHQFLEDFDENFKIVNPADALLAIKFESRMLSIAKRQN